MSLSVRPHLHYRGDLGLCEGKVNVGIFSPRFSDPHELVVNFFFAPLLQKERWGNKDLI